MRTYVAPDGVKWTVQVRSPSASNVIVVFRHGDGSSSSRDRYAHHIWRGEEARNVTARLSPKHVLETLSDADLARLFRRSMPISSSPPEPVPSVVG